ncbi:MAG TPA: sugar phosphate isomerase/epimerase, partial [Verrucomicrobiae bacterium]
MKVGVFTVILGSMEFEQALDYLAGLGVQTVEVGAGAFCGTAHCDSEDLLSSHRKAANFLRAIESRGLKISCLSVHGNPIHPNPATAAAHDAAFRRCVQLASKLNVEVVTTFSGCPGGAPGDTRPNWVTCPWPPEYLEMLDYQWKEAVIPYWSKALEFAREYEIRKIALEMHPGFVVYNP